MASYDLCACGGEKAISNRRCWTCRREQDAPDHGSRSRYVAGCRCDDCRDANRVYQRDRRRGRVLAPARIVEPTIGAIPAGWLR